MNILGATKEAHQIICINESIYTVYNGNLFLWPLIYWLIFSLDYFFSCKFVKNRAWKIEREIVFLSEAMMALPSLTLESLWTSSINQIAKKWEIHIYWPICFERLKRRHRVVVLLWCQIWISATGIIL